MQVQRPCWLPSLVQEHKSLLFCNDTGAFSCGLSTACLQRSDLFFPRKRRIQTKALSSTAISRILARSFTVACWQRRCNLHLQGDPSVLCFQRRARFHLQGDSSVFCESNYRALLCVPHNFSRRRQIVSCGSIKQHSEGSSSSREEEEEKFRDQKAGENGTLSSSSLLFPVALPAEACSEISNRQFSDTKRLVETAMLAAVAGLSYFLSNTLRIENYFGCFFPLPLVISSLRWGVVAGRKTMAATAMLLLVLSGPLKAATYLLMHGFLGLTMGSLWRSKMSWGASVLICTLVRSLGAMGFVFLSSWLIRDNILALITINAHASISFMLAAMGLNFVPSMESIYFIFGMLVLLNCGSFVLILHVLYAIFLKRLGLSSPLSFPTWLKAL